MWLYYTVELACDKFKQKYSLFGAKVFGMAPKLLKNYQTQWDSIGKSTSYGAHLKIMLQKKSKQCTKISRIENYN